MTGRHEPGAAAELAQPRSDAVAFLDRGRAAQLGVPEHPGDALVGPAGGAQVVQRRGEDLAGAANGSAAVPLALDRRFEVDERVPLSVDLRVRGWLRDGAAGRIVLMSKRRSLVVIVESPSAEDASWVVEAPAIHYQAQGRTKAEALCRFEETLDEALGWSSTAATGAP